MPVSLAFDSAQNDRCYSALYSLDLKEPILEEISKFFYVRGGDERDDIEFAGYFVNLFYVRKLVKCLDDVVQCGRLDKNVYKS
jgi:hypothetical protein